MNSVEIRVEEEKVVEVIGNVTSPFVVLSELIKNGVDANAKSVTVHIDTLKNTIKVIDNGDGFTIDDILNIGNIASSSKKRGDYLYNKNGEMLLGSKGLAFYSMFSLGDKIEVKSLNNQGQKYYFEWSKGEKRYYYTQVDDENYTLGTEILISGVEEDNILLLSSEKELSKFKHISLFNFQEKPTVPKVIVIKDGVRFDLDVENINDFKEEFNAVVSFSYEHGTNTLKYKYDVDDARVKNTELAIEIGNSVGMNDILKKVYSIKPIGLSFDDFLTNGLVERKEISVPNFEGKWFMKRDRRGEKFHKFESGIRLYVNKFALYNYLNKNNDWLQLTNVSQAKKNNNFRQHNVYGYVNFDQFNELDSSLMISNERGGFIENINYHKFMDILYMYLLYITINIDYAIKNNYFIQSSNGGQGGQGQGGQGQGGQGQGGQGQGGQGQGGQGQGGQGQGGQGQGGQGQGGQGQGGQGQGGQGQGGQGQGGQGQGGQGQGGQGQGGQGQGGQGQGDQGQGGQGQGGQGQGGNGQANPNEEEESKILQTPQITISQGENCFLLDPTIINLRYNNDLRIIPRSACLIFDNVFSHENSHGEYSIDYYQGDLKETLLIKVQKRKVTGMINDDDFFTTSNHFNGTIDLRDISGLVKQLVGLKYDDKYLLYVISFRAILEEIVKKYYSKRPLLNLNSEFKDNITGMLSDIQSLLRIRRNDPLENQKLEVKKVFKGHYALNNFLVGVNVKFANENYDKFLHSLTHNPSKIDKGLALEVANDIILPLHTLSNLLSDQGII